MHYVECNTKIYIKINIYKYEINIGRYLHIIPLAVRVQVVQHVTRRNANTRSNKFTESQLTNNNVL